MRKHMSLFIIAMLMVLLFCFTIAEGDSVWTCSRCGQTGNDGNFCPNCANPRVTTWICPRCGRQDNTGNYCPNCREKRPEEEYWALTIDNLSINEGPGTNKYFKEVGTYKVKGEYVRIFAKSWDTDNGIWWIQCSIPGADEVIGWTGLKRFDQTTFDLDKLPEIVYDRKTRMYK